MAVESSSLLVVAVGLGALTLVGTLMVWFVASIAGLIARTATVPPPAPKGHQEINPCGNPDCGGDNPRAARFCRRCGAALPAFIGAAA